MTNNARILFEKHASTYDDDLRRRLIPPFDAFYGTAVAALDGAGAEDGAPLRVLDLGAGTGLLSAFVAAAHPDAELVLVDGAPAMLARARERLGEADASFHIADLRDPLPGGTFDAVVSALAIHHLDDAGKRELFARVHAALRPGGVFVNAEQVAGATAEEDAAWRAWHREQSVALGTTPQEWAAAEERMSADRCSPVRDQLAWLTDAGFTATAPFHDHRFAVLVGRTPA
jgi:tRNA (cmo5U34)-methyltransferase